MSEQQFRRAARKLGSNLRRRRRALGLTQEDAAERLDMVVRQYQKIEGGTANLTLRTLLRVGRALQTSPKALLEGV